MGFKKGTYIIGSGWYCDGKGRESDMRIKSPGKAIGLNRSREFSKMWYNLINRFTNPEKIIIVDSDSPLKPDFPKDKRIERINMKMNFGAPHLKQGLLSGGERAFLLGYWYAMLNDVEYFVYIEQDCLIYGKEIIEEAIKNMKGHKISFRTLTIPSYGVDWCFCVIRTDYILDWMNQYLNLDTKEFIRSEIKFKHLKEINVRYVSTIPPSIGKKPIKPIKIEDFKELPFGYGRDRPIDFTKEHFFAQQWTQEELNKMMEKIEWQG